MSARPDRSERLRARAVAIDALLPIASQRVSKSERKRILETTKGLGPIADRLIDEQRDRL